MPEEAKLEASDAELVVSLRAEVAQLREALEPGKASAIAEGMFREAERLGHSPFSSKHALTYLVELAEIGRVTLDHTEPRWPDEITMAEFGGTEVTGGFESLLAPRTAAEKAEDATETAESGTGFSNEP